MKLIEALTTKRPKDGKVADWAEAEGLSPLRFGDDGALQTRMILGDGAVYIWEDVSLITKHDLTRTDFTPMWEAPVPMVPKPGEVWELTVLGIAYSAFTFRHFSSDAIKRVWADGIDREDISKVMIHGQNGWRLVWSPDPERMRRAQNG